MFSNFSIGASIAQKNFIKLIRENLLGFLWIFITPVVYAVFFLLVKQSIVGDSSEPMELKISALNAFVGLILIQLWFQVIQDSANIVRRNKGSLRALDVSVYPFLLAIFIETFIHLLIRFFIIFIALLLVSYPFSLTAKDSLLLTLSFSSFIFSALFIGLILAPWSSLFSDIRKMLSSALMPVALLSPIFYFPVDDSGAFLFWVNQIIPFATVQAVISQTLFETNDLYEAALFFWFFLSLFGSLLLAVMLKHQTPILLERMGS